MRVFDYLAYAAIRTIIGLLNLLPLGLRIFFIVALLRVFSFCVPRYHRIAVRNLDLAFPNKDRSWKQALIKKNYESLARLVVDSARLQHLGEQWVKEHIEFDNFEGFKAIKEKNSKLGKGIVIATGHLGSFELLSHGGALYGYPLSFVVRNFKLSLLDRWWISIREKNGNSVIPRKGAFKKIVRNLKSGIDVGILFDQNVIKRQAIFVDFFGEKAATTFALALAALKTEATILVASIKYVGNDHYKIIWEECHCEALYSDPNLDQETKLAKITEQVSKAWEKRILDCPEAWFWMHRRWKTRPHEDDASFY